MNVIKYMDFFGVKFHFYVNNQPNFQNVFGGMMSIIYFFVCIILFFIYNLEDLKRINPISTTSEFPFSEQKLVNINEEKIWIPFRIVTDEKKYIDHRGVIKITPLLIEGELGYDNSMNLKYSNLSYKLCNETSMANKPEYYSIDIPLNELYCIDQENITFGGDWNKNVLNYIEIGLYLCDGVGYNENDPKCSGLVKLMETLNSSLCLDLYFPVVQFQPTNFKNPISIIYKNYFYKLSTYAYKLQKLYIQEHILSDDINLAISNSKNQSFWGFNSFFSDSYSLPNKVDPLIKNRDQKSYVLEIYMDSGIIHYSRTYKKIFAMISDTFPFFNLIFYLFRYFTYYIKISLIKRNLAEFVFERAEIKQKIQITKKVRYINRPHYSDKNHLYLKFDNNIDKRFLRKSSQASNPKNENKISSSNNQSNVGLEDENIIKILNKKEISTLSKNNQNESIHRSFRIRPSFKSNKSNEKKRTYKHIFPFYYFLLDFIFDKLHRPKHFFCIPKLYFTTYNYMCRMYDISTHIYLLKQFKLNNNLLTEILSKDNGISYSKSINKINLNDENTIEKINIDLIENKSIILK